MNKDEDFLQAMKALKRLRGNKRNKKYEIQSLK